MSMNQKNVYRVYQNLPAIITEELREAILNGELAAGERLKQEEIASRFQSSLIPVREALRSLEMEGLVTIYPNKGAVVSELSSDEVKQIFETRIILELGALELSIPNLDAEDIAKAQDYIDLLDKADSGKALSSYNREFHHILYGRCNNDYLLNLVNGLHRNVERYMRVYLLDHYHHDLSQTYHKKILEAVKERNIEKAQVRLRIHMKMAMDQLVAAIKTGRGGPV